MKISLNIRGGSQLVAKLERAPQNLRDIIRRELGSFAPELRQAAADNVRSRTGRLAQGVEATTIEDGDILGVRLDTPTVPYGGAVEEGASIPPHAIFPLTARALMWVAVGGQAFAAHVMHPGALIRGQHFERRAIESKQARFADLLRAAIREAIT